MPLEHDDAPRFTLDQRDAILNLAARLQVQHEATVGVDELFAEAVAAGIDPRFVHDAAMRLGRKSQPRHLRSPLFAFVLFTLQACLFMLYECHWFNRGGTSLEWPLLFFAGAISLLLALWAARQPIIRRFVPLAALVVWIATAIPFYFLVGSGSDWVLPVAFAYAATQSLAALIGLFAAVYVERTSRNARSFRLYRGHEA